MSADRAGAAARGMAAPAPELAAPLTFAPVLKQYMWGGRELERLFGRELPDGAVAESWEISGHPAGPSVVDAGPLAGTDLPTLVARHGAALVGRRGRAAAERGEFPLLVKLLDASHALSVQVHPDDDCAAAHGLDDPGKTEMWYVASARPGAAVILGLAPGTDRAAFERAVERGRVPDCLNRVPVRAGDAVMVPAGTVHGILSGIVLVEVQQCSDTTYRIHDWGRAGPDGRPRELHLERALDAIRFGGADGREGGPERHGAPDGLLGPAGGGRARLQDSPPGVAREVLAHCEHFRVERVAMEAGAVLDLQLGGETFEAWGVLEGEASVQGADPARPPVRLRGARFALLPAAMGEGEVRAATGAVALRGYLPRAAPS